MIEDVERFTFGDSPEMADKLLALVLAGTKTATCGALREYEHEGSPLPQPGQRAVVLDGMGTPGCMIEYTRVECRPFDPVDADFARREGEGDMSLAAWRDIHRGFFTRNGGFAPDMLLVCQEFRVIERMAAP
jgi:uncharacterized protein YhfF